MFFVVFVFFLFFFCFFFLRVRSRVYSWYTVFSEMQFISGNGNQPELSSEIGTTWAELSSDIGTTWAELSWADFFMGQVVLGQLVFGPSCPEPNIYTV